MTRRRRFDARWIVAIALALLFVPAAAGETGAARQDVAEDPAEDAACFGPRNVAAKARPDGILVTWDPLNDAVTYIITRINGGSNTTTVDAPKMSFLDRDVDAGVTYTYKVGALVDSDPDDPGGVTATGICGHRPVTAVAAFPTAMAAALAALWAVGFLLLMPSRK